MKATAQIFLSYAREDAEKVEKLYQRLSDAGFKPWMDKKDILPGERWESSIRRAVRRSDFFLACLSANSVNKRGWIQTEMRRALDLWLEKLDSDIYLIPVRLEDCEVPEVLGKFQWVNLFEEDGWTRLVKAIQLVGMERRGEITSEHEQLQRELEFHRRNLRRLREIVAQYVPSEAPLHLLNQIEAEETEIAKLERTLLRWYPRLVLEDARDIEDELQSLEKQLEIHRRNLMRLHEKRAMYGLDVPVYIQTEIEYLKEEIAQLEQRLLGLLEQQSVAKGGSPEQALLERLTQAQFLQERERRWKTWQRAMDNLLAKKGVIELANLTIVPQEHREYALDRYYQECKDTMNINRTHSGAIKLENAEQITAFFQKWEEAAASMDGNQRHFASLATELANQLGDLGFLCETNEWIRSQGALHGFMIAVPPLELKVPLSFPLVFIQQREFTAEDVDRIQKLKIALGAPDTYFVFLFTLNGTDKVREITQRTMYDIDFIVFDKELLYCVLTARDKEKALTQAITQQASLKRVSPYVIYGPVPLDKVFFGREREINAIVSAVKDASIALVGGRKMGKTSILDRAARSLEQRPDLHLLRLDCQKISDYASFFDKLRALPETHDISIAKDNTPPSFGTFVTEVQKRVPDRRIVLVMDEVDDLLKKDREETLFGTFRSLSQEGRCSFVLCGAKVLYERLHTPQSALFNFCNALPLSYLDLESAAKIVTDPMRKMGITLKDESFLVNRILAITSGHPNLIQFLCQTILEYIDRRGRRDISLEDVLKVSEADEFREFFMEVVWGDATPLEKIITLLLVEKRALNEHGIRQGLQEKGIPVTIKQLKQALQGLQLYSILTKRRDQFVFVAEFFPQVIGENRDQIDWLVEEFLEEMKETGETR